jgi:lipoprotein-releasing system ATP-binding protein
MNKRMEERSEAPEVLVTVEHLRKSYALGRASVEVLRDVNLELRLGERVAVIGASGAGKSTLLHVLGGLEQPSGGRVLFKGEDLYGVSARRRNILRATRIGLVFQFYHLLPELDVLENVCLPAMNPLAARRLPPEAVTRRARDLLEAVGLGKRLTHLPMELSGGEQQRVALARALMNRPSFVLADEPTGNLDPATGRYVLDGLFDLVDREAQTLIVVTHNADVAERCPRVMELKEGRLCQC